MSAAQALMAEAQQCMLQARFALAQTNDDNKNHWAEADSHSARSSLTPEVRKRMRERSRLESENSSWYCGILATARNHIVGTGPRLQVTTANAAGNTRLENAWAAWWSAAGMTEKLAVAVETYWRDGEVYLMRAKRPALGAVDLDVRLYESEQCHSPYLSGSFGSFTDPYQDDGIRIDPGSNELEYWFADHHPSDPFYNGLQSGRWYSSKNVIHLYRKSRPGQLHGYPRFASGLPLLAIMRRFEMATCHAAEAVANVALYMKTPSTAYLGSNSAPFTTAPTARNVMMLLPDGCDLFQPKMETPNSNLEMFVRQMMMAFCRAGNVPLGLGVGTSKDSNFSSFKGDIRNTWQPEVKAEQDRLTSVCVERIFGWFLEDVIYDPSYVDHLGQVVPGVLDGMPPINKIDHQWFWDSLPPLDEVDAATAAQIRVSTGQSSLPQEYADRGIDFDTAMERGASGFGIPVEEYKRAIFAKVFGTPQGSTVGGQPVAAVPGQGDPAAASGEYTKLGQRDWNNNQKRIRSILDTFVSGEISEGRARLMLQGIGLAPETVQGYLDDASDGRVDAPELQTPVGAGVAA